MRLSNKIKLGLISLALFAGLNMVDASISKRLPKSSISNNFPASYTTYINNLKQKYPNATFKAVYTGLDWNTVLKHESYEVSSGISLIPSSYDNVWKKDNKNIYKDGYFVVASKGAVAYVLDPRNSLYEKYIFQFEGLTYNNAITTSVIEKVIASSPMVGIYAKKYKKSGSWQDMDMSYSEIINKVGKELNVSSVYIASRMIQETSGDIVNNGSINGSNSRYPGVYNFFNIGAVPDKNGDNAVLNGLIAASKRGWTTPYKSIYGGVDEIKSSYIKYGQDTVYFQKFDVNNPYGNAQALMAYQYQTNIMAPKSESTISYNAYKKLGMLDTPFTFYIPVYNNMPEDPTPYPAGDSAKFVEDNTLVYLDDGIKNGTDAFNVRSSASSELDNIIYTLTEAKEGSNNRQILTRVKKGVGYNWDLVEFTKGNKKVRGYVWNEYVQDYNYVKVTDIKLNKTDITLEIDDTFKLEATINPSNAKYKDVVWSVEDSNILDVKDGLVKAKCVGKTNVVVKSVDQEKTATCTVNVVPKTTQIITDKDEYFVSLGNYITPNRTVKNDTSYDMQIVDEDIACIEDEKIKGLKEGTTILKITTKTNKVVKEVKITVTKEYIEIDKSLNVNGEIITKVTPNTTVETIKNKFKLVSLNMEIVNASNNKLSNSDKVGTDTKILIYKEDKTLYKTYKIRILGDVTSDGVINSADLLRIVKYLNKTATLNEKAADTNKDGKVNSADLLRIVKYLNKTATIDFN